MDLVRERILDEPRRSRGSREGDLELARRRALELPMQQLPAEGMARVASEDAREARLLFEGMGRAHLEHAVSSQLEIHHDIYHRRRDGHLPPPARTPGTGQRGGATSGVVRQLWGTEPGLAAAPEGGACDDAYAARPPAQGVTPQPST